MSDKPGESAASPLEVASGAAHKSSRQEAWGPAKHISYSSLLVTLMVLCPIASHALIQYAEKQGLESFYIISAKVLHFLSYVFDFLMVVRFLFRSEVRNLRSLKPLLRRCFQSLTKVGTSIAKFNNKPWLRVAFYYAIVTLIGIVIGLALLALNPFGHQSSPISTPEQRNPPYRLNPEAPPSVSDNSRRPAPKVSRVQVPPSAPQVQNPAPQSEVEAPEPLEQQETTPPVRPRKPIRIPSNVVPSKEPPVMVQDRPPKPIEPAVPSPVAPEPLSPIRPEPAPATSEEAQISVGGDSINVFPPTGPTLVTKATFGKLPPNFEAQLTDMRLVVTVDVDEVGHASVIGDTEFPANFPNSHHLRGLLNSQVKAFVERSVWRAARDDNGVQTPKKIILVVILGTKP